VRTNKLRSLSKNNTKLRSAKKREYKKIRERFRSNIKYVKYKNMLKEKLPESVCGTKKVKNLKDLPKKDLEEAQQDINDEVSYGRESKM